MRASSRRSFLGDLAGAANALRSEVAQLPDDFGASADAKAQLATSGLLALRVMAGSTGPFTRQRALAVLAGRVDELDWWLGVVLSEHAPQGLRREVDAALELLSQPAAAHWLAATPEPLLACAEHFVRRWERAERRARGAYFTPPALAAYVVARVDAVLEKELGFPLGLADEGVLDTPLEASPLRAASAWRVLDPAAGSGVFLAAVIGRIHQRMQVHHGALGLTDAQRRQAWQTYVRTSLLPRLVGFEVMPLSHALCHLQVRLSLFATGYELQASDHVRVHRVDALAVLSELASGESAKWSHILSEHAPITVVLGNPPYARGRGGDAGLWAKLLAPYKAALRAEKNLQPLSDAYVRFVRVTECLLERAPFGVAGLVSNATYLHGHLLRGMRASLLTTFPHIDVLDLGGNNKESVRGPDDARDENVFDVSQGIAVSVLRRGERVTRAQTYASLRGRRADKLAVLASGSVPEGQSLSPAAPDYLFSPRQSAPGEYAGFPALDDLFSFSSIGAKPGDDAKLVAFQPNEALQQLAAWHAELRVEASRARTEAARRLALLASLPARPVVMPYAYRPFDTRFVVAVPEIWTRNVRRLRERLDGEPMLLATRFAQDAPFAHVFATRLLPDVIFLSNKTSVNAFAFPRTSLSTERFTAAVSREVSRDEAFAYLYAVLHAPSYRLRYAAGLRSGLPRVPLLRFALLFSEVARLGQRLLELHLGEAELLGLARPTFVDGGDRHIHGALALHRRLDADAAGHVRVSLNALTRFEGVPAASWHFRVGGYQVCHKWLLDRMRRGRALCDADVARYLEIVAAVTETLGVMAAIDAVIAAHGGWPDLTAV